MARRAATVARARAAKADSARVTTDAITEVFDLILPRLQPYQVVPTLESLPAARHSGAVDIWPSKAEEDPLKALLDEWNTFVTSSGRGVGKTFGGAANSVLLALRAVAEAVQQSLAIVEANPELPFHMPESIVVFAAGPTWSHVLQTMLFESDSSVVSMLPDWAYDEKRSPRSISGGFPMVTLDLGIPSRVSIMGLSAQHPESWRGREGFHAWWDEPAACVYATECYRQMQQLLRRSNDPKLLLTCTPNFTHPSQELIWTLCQAAEGDPEAIARLRTEMGGLLGGGAVVRRQVPSWANKLMPQSWRDEQFALAETGTPWARQEVLGELAEPTAGVLLARDAQKFVPKPDRGQLAKVIVGVDPATGDGTRDEWGIVVLGKLKKPVIADAALGARVWFVVLEDCSLGAHPEDAVKVVAETAVRWNADFVLAERNQGGEAMATLIQNALIDEGFDPAKFDTCWSSDNKGARAAGWASRVRMGLMAFAADLYGGLLSSQCAMWDPERDARNSPDRIDGVGIAAIKLGLMEPVPVTGPSRPAAGYKELLVAPQAAMPSHRPQAAPPEALTIPGMPVLRRRRRAPAIPPPATARMPRIVRRRKPKVDEPV